MSKRFVVVTLAAALFSAPAAAQGILPAFYAGADFQHTMVSYADIPGTGLNGSDFFSDSLSGGHFHIGARFAPMFGAEVGYLWIPEHEKDLSGGTSTIDVHGVTFDGMIYAPLGMPNSFELVGLGGISYLTATAVLSGPGFGGTSSDEDSEWGWRVGGGGQFQVSSNVNVRGLIIYQSADFDGDVDDAFQFSLGVNFLFP